MICGQYDDDDDDDGIVVNRRCKCDDEYSDMSEFVPYHKTAKTKDRIDNAGISHHVMINVLVEDSE